MSLLFDLQGMPALNRDEQDFLRTGLAPARAIILSAGDHRGAASMRDVAADIPLAALDINGKSLLQRQTEALALAGIQDVTVVTGYRHDAVRADGVQLIENARWATTGEAASLMCAPMPSAAAGDVRTLVIYGDLLFDADLVQRLLRSEDDITIVADRNHAHEANIDDKRRDLVRLTAAPAPGHRFLGSGVLREVRSVGPALTLSEADGEFAGLSLFSAAAWTALRSRYESRSAEQPCAAVTDLLQQSIDAGQRVVALEVTSGWLEIHSFDDYEHACQLVAR